MFHEYLQGSLEALLFAAGEPLTVAQIAGIMQLDKPQVWELLTMLEESYNEENCGLCLRKVAGGYQLCAKPQHYNFLPALCTFKTAGARAGSKIIGSGNGNFGHCCV